MEWPIALGTFVAKTDALLIAGFPNAIRPHLQQFMARISHLSDGVASDTMSVARPPNAIC